MPLTYRELEILLLICVVALMVALVNAEGRNSVATELDCTPEHIVERAINPVV